jgi:ubiquitin-protein ligase
MNRNSRVRIQKDFTDLLSTIKKNDNLCYEEDTQCKLSEIRDMTKFTIILNGPKDSPYENGKFKLNIKIPQDYPDDPPVVKIMTKTYHPNIKDSNICLDILDNNWKPTYTLSKVFESIYYLLKTPNPNDPLSAEVNSVYQRNYQLYLETAKEWTEKYAGLN